MITAELIKKLVQRESKVDNISIPSRVQYYVDIRSVYFDLCRIYLNVKTAKQMVKVSSLVDRDRTTYLHAIKIIKKNLYTNQFQANDEYKAVNNELIKLSQFDPNYDIPNLIRNSEEYSKLLFAINQHWRLKHIALSEKSHNLINKYKQKHDDIESKLNKLDYNIIDAVQELSHSDLNELQERNKLFIKVKKSLNANREFKNVMQ